MKIYTEINYEFKDGELIEIDSDSFEYEGEVLLCEGVGDAATEAKDEAVEEFVEEPMEEVMEEMTEPVYEMNAADEEEEDRLTASGVSGNSPSLAALSINKKTKGTGFTRGSLRVRKPKRIAV